jgi:hypothetical protein
MDKQFKLLYKAIRRMADMIGLILLLAAIWFGLRGF